MIHVIATIQLVSSQVRDEFLGHFHAVMPKVHAEQGCIEYGPTVDATTDIAAQIPQRSDVVVIVEKWESLAALKAHITAPHMDDYRQQVKSLVSSVALQILEPA